MTNRIIKPFFEHTDERGTLREIVRGNWKTINYHDRKSGYTAGGHYHREIEEYFYVISGRVEVELQKLGETEKERFTVRTNEGFLIPTNHYHSLHFLEDSKLIALLSKAWDNDNPDVYK